MKFLRLIAIALMVFALVAIAVYAVSPLTDTGYIVRNIFYLSAPAIAVVFGLTAIWHYGVPNRHSFSLLFIVVGLLFWLIGEIIFFSYTLTNVDPFPSVADYFYILGYIPLAVGFIREVNIARVRLSGGETLAVLFFASVLVAATLYFGLVVAYDSTSSTLSNAVAIGYTIGDVILVLVATPVLIFVYRHRQGRVVGPWIWYITALLLTLGADTLYANYSDLYDVLDPVAMQIDLLWIVGYLSFAFGFAQQASVIRELRARAKSK